MLVLRHHAGKVTAFLLRFRTVVAGKPWVWGTHPECIKHTTQQTVLAAGYPELPGFRLRFRTSTDAEKAADAVKYVAVAAALESDPAFPGLCARFDAEGDRGLPC